MIHVIFFNLLETAMDVGCSETEKKPLHGRKYRGGIICAAPNCHNRYYNSSVSMFSFPKEKQRYTKLNTQI